MRKISLILLGVLCLVLTGCNNKSKEVKSLDDFTVACTNNGYDVKDNMESYTNATYITEAKKATLDEIEVEMVKYDTLDNAKKVQDNIIKTFKEIKSPGAVGESDKGANYYRYTLISNGYYMICSRIDNTLIFSKTEFENKDKVDKIFDNLDY